MPELGGFKAWIEVDGAPLDEYCETREGVETVTCHVASQAGKQFVIQVEDNSGLADKTERIAPSVNVYLDGTWVANFALGGFESDRLSSFYIDKAKTIAAVDAGESKERFLQFACIKLSEDGCPSTGQPELIGTVKVDITFMKLLRRIPYEPDIGQATKSSPVELHERSKKGGGNCSTLSEGAADTTFSYYDIQSETCPKMPSYNFIFRHASRDWLQATDIIPSPRTVLAPQELNIPQRRSNEPGPSSRKRKAKSGSSPQAEVDSDLEHLSDGEREAFLRMKEKIATRKRSKIKTEVKEEPGTRRLDPAVIEISD